MKVLRRARTKVVHSGHVLCSDRAGCGRMLPVASDKYASSVELAFQSVSVALAISLCNGSNLM